MPSSVFNSGVSRMPPSAQIDTKKNAHPARNSSSVLSCKKLVTRSMARNITGPNGLSSTRTPKISASSESPISNSKSRQRTLAKSLGWPATSKAQNHLTWALAAPANMAFARIASGNAAASSRLSGSRFNVSFIDPQPLRDTSCTAARRPLVSLQSLFTTIIRILATKAPVNLDVG